MEKKTIALSTKKQYYNKAVLLMAKAYKEALSENDENFTKNSKEIILNGKSRKCLTLLHTVVWAVKNWPDKLMNSSWVFYRASLNHMADISFNNKEIDEKQKEKIKVLLSKVQGGTKYDIDVRTSRKKKKSFSTKEKKELFRELIKSKNKWAKPLIFWIEATIGTGLRPIEWRDAKYNEISNSIIVKNAKNTNGRSHGEFRTINLNHLSKEEIASIKNHLKISSEINKNGKWDIYYQGCTNLLKYEARKLWPNKEKRPTLYSARHQFSANLKASNCKRNEVATLMGHKSEDTATTHYGKKIHGTRKKKPEVNDIELQRVNLSKKPRFTLSD